MHIKNAKRWAPEGVEGYFVALFAFLAVFAVRYAASDALDDSIPFLGFLIAAMLIQYRYGLGPSMMVLVLGFPTGFYYFVKPFGSFSLAETSLGDIFVTLGNIAAFAVGVGLIEQLQRARFSLRLLGEVAKSRYEILLRSEAERQSAVAQARASREHFRTFTATVGEVLYMKRVGGGFEYVNEMLASRSGTPAEDLLGGNWTSVMHPEDAALITEQMAQVIESRQTSLSEFRLRLADGSYAVFEGSLSVMADERGVVIRWTGNPQQPIAFFDPPQTELQRKAVA
jgi:PAS domain S-box-containing protein